MKIKPTGSTFQGIKDTLKQKLSQSGTEAREKLKEAKEQLIAKKYDKLITNKNIVRLAIVAINTRQNKKEQDYFEIARIEEL